MTTYKKYVSQAVTGILLVNKPQGLTSNAVLQQVKHLYQAKKAGHTGSLDPMATGMLPICFGEGTKFCQYLLDADKCYETTGLLGIKTNTGDAMGEVISREDSFTLSESILEEVLSQFRGLIKQIPSMFSAIKHQGTPLYKYARAGKSIDREAREVLIHDLVLNRFDGQQFDLTVSCSKGTYIRNLVEDIGDKLGVGAHVTRLHRAYTSGFKNEKMYTLDELHTRSHEELLSYLLPIDRAICHLPRLSLSPDDIQSLRHGKTITCPVKEGFLGCVSLYENDSHLVGLGELEPTGVLKVKRLLTSAV